MGAPASSPGFVARPEGAAAVHQGAVDEATIRAHIEHQRWDEDVEGFKITAPREPRAGSRPGADSDWRRGGRVDAPGAP